MLFGQNPCRLPPPPPLKFQGNISSGAWALFDRPQAGNTQNGMCVVAHTRNEATLHLVAGRSSNALRPQKPLKSVCVIAHTQNEATPQVAQKENRDIFASFLTNGVFPGCTPFIF